MKKIEQKHEMPITVFVHEPAPVLTIRSLYFGSGDINQQIHVEFDSIPELIKELQKHAPASVNSPSAREATARNNQRLKDIDGMS